MKPDTPKKPSDAFPPYLNLGRTVLLNGLLYGTNICDTPGSNFITSQIWQLQA